MKNKAKALVLSAALLSSTANAIDLSGTIFDKAAKAYNLDPLLVYSVALAESASGRGNGSISPWPWTLRVPGLPLTLSRKIRQRLSSLSFSSSTVVPLMSGLCK